MKQSVKSLKPFAFIIQAALAGLLIAIIILLLWHRSTPPPASTPPITPQLNDQQPGSNILQTPSRQFGGPFSYAQAVATAAPSVVNIFTTKTVTKNNRRRSSLFERFFGVPTPQRQQQRKQSGLGSGVIFSDQGYIVTNYHVIREAEDIHVYLRDGRDFPAKLVGADPETDLAILHIDADQLKSIELGQSDFLQVGDVVLAIGNPFGVGQTVTMGIVSATGRDSLGINAFENFIQTDAAINPGNSGGALVNPLGKLVGINTAIFSKSGGSQGIGFAIPVDMVKAILSDIIQYGKVIRGWLGVEAREIPAAAKAQLAQRSNYTHGVWIVGVLGNSPADQAGIKAGDIVTTVNNTAIFNSQILLKEIAKHRPGEQLTVEIMRNGKVLIAQATLVQRPSIPRR